MLLYKNNNIKNKINIYKNNIENILKDTIHRYEHMTTRIT
jgi:hypothetical protein